MHLGTSEVKLPLIMPGFTAPKLAWVAGIAVLLALGGCSTGLPQAGSVAAIPAASAAPGTAAIALKQAGNPLHGLLDSYRHWLSTDTDPAAALAADRASVDNIVSWQMPHGGFYKLPDRYARPWDGKAPRADWHGRNGEELGTIDNEATVTEILFLADVYARSGVVAYRDSARRALEFLLNMQYPSGGFPQVYPARGVAYSNNVTFNDNAMVRALALFARAAQHKAPLGGDVFSAAQHARLAPALERAEDYILKAQIVHDGVRTVWCAQHDPVDYRPVGGRAYELPSRSGMESAALVAFLMSRPQTPAVAAAVKAALAWYRRDAVQLKDTGYDKRGARRTGTSPFVPRPGSTAWYRFYELDTDRGFVVSRTASGIVVEHDVMKLPPENRYSYDWGGVFAEPLLAYAAKLGY
jgi:PelA/Pel-15E family pectate lyase